MNAETQHRFEHMREDVGELVTESEAEHGVSSADMILSILNGDVQRTPAISKWLVSHRIGQLMDQFGFENLVEVTDGYIAGPDKIFRLGVVETPDGGRLSFAEVHDCAWFGPAIHVKNKYWFYHAEMADTELSIFFYDNFYGPLVRQDFNGGEITQTEFGEGKMPPPLDALIHQTEEEAKTRRVF